MTLYFIYLLKKKKKLSWSHSSFHLFNQLLRGGGGQNDNKNKALLQRLNSDVFFYCFFHALCCIVLFIETSTCTRAKRPTLEGVRMDWRVPVVGEALHIRASKLKSFLLEMEHNHIYSSSNQIGLNSRGQQNKLTMLKGSQGTSGSARSIPG